MLLVKLDIDMGLEAVLPGPQNALYVMLCYIKNTDCHRSIVNGATGTRTNGP